MNSEVAKNLDSIKIFSEDFFDSMGSEFPNQQVSPIKHASPIKTEKRKHSDKSPSKRKSVKKQKSVKKKDTPDVFMKLASSVYWPSSRKLNPQDDAGFFPPEIRNNDAINEDMVTLTYAFCVSSLTCGDEYLKYANKHEKVDYVSMLKDVYKIKEKSPGHLNVLNEKLAFIKDKYKNNQKDPIDIIIGDLKKTIKGFENVGKGGKKSTKKSRTKKARK